MEPPFISPELLLPISISTPISSAFPSHHGFPDTSPQTKLAPSLNFRNYQRPPSPTRQAHKVSRSSTTLQSPAMSSQDTRSTSQRLRPRRPSTFLTLSPIISGAEQKPKDASADEVALESPTESVKQVEADSAEALKRRTSSVSSQSSNAGGFRFLRNH